MPSKEICPGLVGKISQAGPHDPACNWHRPAGAVRLAGTARGV